MTKLSSTLPKGDGNGLETLARQLVDEPHKVHVVVCLVDCKKTTTDIDTGDVEATARVRRIEAISGEDIEKAAQMLRRALEKRTGREVLPFDLEDDLTQLLEALVDPETGEVRRGGPA